MKASYRSSRMTSESASEKSSGNMSDQSPVKASLKTTWQTMKRLLNYVKPDEKRFWSDLAMSALQDLIMQTVLALGLVLIFQSIMEKRPELLRDSVILMGGGFLALGLITYVGDIRYGQAGLRASGRLRKQLVSQLLHLTASW